MFKLYATYSPSGDQPAAIDALVRGLNNHHQHQCLLGVTGSGKTFTMANVIAKVNRPTLILAHNKTLAAQLYSEFREFFPENAVHYFVSYFDYYQPEAYIASSDTYIEKDSAINEEIDRLRHGATESLLSRRDVVIVASVSCIYGLGSPAHYQSMAISIRRQGDIWLPFAPLSPVEAAEQAIDPTPISAKPIDLNTLSRALINMQYHRNDLAFERGNFRVKGETLDLYPAASDHGYRFNFNFDQLETVKLIDPLTGEPLETLSSLTIFPNTHYATPKDTVLEVIPKIRAEFEKRHQLFLKQQKYLEAERLSQRVRYDLEMLAETGFVKGIENYSRYLDGRKPGQAPYTLLDFFPPDFLLMIDESHMTIPQVRGMYNGDHARKLNLVEYGFRLPSALDNRPLNFGEFEQRVHQTIYVSATPGPYELEKSGEPIQQVIRPTGLLDPEIEVRPTDGQIDDLISEITARINKNKRVLVTTLTKRMAEDLTEYLQDLKIKTAYLHSDIDTLERGDILRDLRSGVYDVLIGINLLREGLDLPEVSLVAILDADKEGFLRSNSALIQTIGRAARHLEGHVIMYADRITDSMAAAIDTTNQRRELQSAYNLKHHITPKSIQREVSAGLRAIIPEKAVETPTINLAKIPVAEYKELRKQLVSDMQIAAADLDFERAATLRDAIKDIDAKLQKS